MGLRLDRPPDHLTQCLDPHAVGIPACTRLKDIPFPIDMVSDCRPEGYVPDIARGAVAVDAETRWQQRGLRSAEADRIATEAGLDSVRDRCLTIKAARTSPL
jgi:predicted CoA-binding protein